ncbi:PEP-CTERM sorting domain-containing protein [Akkermansiaceae bacterium]|nr:PEP-CTERM sorting domain-containing protein [Akkermansiaceae bacterium]
MKTQIRLAAGVLAILASPLLPAAVVVSWDFDSGVEGWTSSLPVSPFTQTTVDPVAASGGFLSGTALSNNNDPQLYRTGLNLTPGAGESWVALTFRVRETQDADNIANPAQAAGIVTVFNSTGLILSLNNSSQAISSPANGTVAADGWFEVTYNISGFNPATPITQIRLDPIGGARSNSNSETANNLFEVDFIRLSDSSVIPEPSTALLAFAGALGLLRRRRQVFASLP